MKTKPKIINNKSQLGTFNAPLLTITHNGTGSPPPDIYEKTRNRIKDAFDKYNLSALPVLTHIQFATLRLFGVTAKSGPALREDLKQMGIPMHGPNFNQFLKSLEAEELIESFYSRAVNPTKPRERYYLLTSVGVIALVKSKNFYEKPLNWQVQPAAKNS